MSDLAGRTLFISGASRGIGLAIALRAARDGANVALIAKTAEPHPKLEGTVHTAAAAIEQAGGQALAFVGDIRDADAVNAAVDATVERFGGIDIAVNNASAINLQSVADLEPKRYDLLQDINVRGTYLVSRACLPHLKRSKNGHLLTMSPPINLDPKWLAPMTAYTVSKYGMTLMALGLAAELRSDRVASNTLWPRTMVNTAAIRNLLGGEEAVKRSRKVEVYADSAYWILTQPSDEVTAHSFLCEDVLVAAGEIDLARYNVAGRDAELGLDLYVDGADPTPV